VSEERSRQRGHGPRSPWLTKAVARVVQGKAAASTGASGLGRP
jgi:hypothetical protein